MGSTTLQMDSGSVILFCLFVCTDTCVAVRLGRCRFHTKQQRAQRDRERQRGTSTIFFLSSFLPFLLSCCLSVCTLSLSFSLVCLDELVHQLGLRLELGVQEAHKEREIFLIAHFLPTLHVLLTRFLWRISNFMA